MAPRTRCGVTGRRRGGRRAHEADVPSQEMPEIEETQVPLPDTATPPQRNMVMMSVEELQNLLQTTMTSQVTNIVDAVLTNRSGQGHRDQFTSQESRYLRDFKKYDLPQFEGRALDTEAAEGWLEAIESAFKYKNCPDTHKVHCATYMLKDRAHFWWESVLRSLENVGEPVTWEHFVRHSFENIIPGLSGFKGKKSLYN